ncbi:MAG: ABC transporter ATP-binding protein, partial [Enterococcus sp.]
MSTKQFETYNTEIPQDFKSTGRRLFQLLMEQKGRFIVIIISAIFFATLIAMTPLILGWGLDVIIHLIQKGEVTPNYLFQELWGPVCLLFLAWGLIAVFSLLQEYT